MANKEKTISFRISEEQYYQFKKICEKKDINMSDVLLDFVNNYIEQNKILLQDAKPLLNEVEWISLNEFHGLPELYVNVVNFTASIWYKGQDVTDQIPNGEELAREAAFVAGGGINRKGSNYLSCYLIHVIIPSMAVSVLLMIIWKLMIFWIYYVFLIRSTLCYCRNI